MEKYSLYIGNFCRTNDMYSFYNGKYMLIYTDQKAPVGFVKIPLEKEKNITPDERAWLLSCKMEINRKAMKEAEEEYSDILNSFVNLFEEELQKASKGVKEDHEA